MIQIIARKFLYSTFFNIDARIIEKAIRTNEHLEIITPKGTVVWDARTWKRTGKESKQVFRFKDNPLRLIGNYCFPIEETDSKQITLKL